LGVGKTEVFQESNCGERSTARILETAAFRWPGARPEGPCPAIATAQVPGWLPPIKQRPNSIKARFQTPFLAIEDFSYANMDCGCVCEKSRGRTSEKGDPPPWGLDPAPFGPRFPGCGTWFRRPFLPCQRMFQGHLSRLAEPLGAWTFQYVEESPGGGGEN